MVDSISVSNPSYNDKKYVLLPANKEYEGTIYYTETIDRIKQTFKNCGLKVVDNILDSQCVAFITLNFKDAKNIETMHSIPVYGKYGIVAFDTYKEIDTFYTHSIGISAFSLTKDFKTDKELWKIIAVTSNSNGDFRDALKYLGIILDNYIAKNTSGCKHIVFSEKNGQLYIKEQ